MSEGNQPELPEFIRNLRFTPRSVHETEQREKRSILEIVGDVSTNTVLVLLRAAGYQSDEEAYAAIDKYLEETNKDVMTLQVDLMTRMEEQGFLPKGLGIGKKIRKELNKMTVADTLESAG